ncbi:MAG: hypothetical protein KAH20_12765 [Methylococcales bacterium]|nr:hypothetical protein [Methylococcales bacterium]
MDTFRVHSIGDYEIFDEDIGELYKVTISLSSDFEYNMMGSQDFTGIRTRGVRTLGNIENYVNIRHNDGVNLFNWKARSGGQVKEELGSTCRVMENLHWKSIPGNSIA